MRYITQLESIKMALDRKRRLRKIYKWRNNLSHTHQPAHRDSWKLKYLEMFR